MCPIVIAREDCTYKTNVIITSFIMNKLRMDAITVAVNAKKCSN